MKSERTGKAEQKGRMVKVPRVWGSLDSDTELVSPRVVVEVYKVVQVAKTIPYQKNEKTVIL